MQWALTEGKRSTESSIHIPDVPIKQSFPWKLSSHGKRKLQRSEGGNRQKVNLWNKGSCWRDCCQFWPGTPQSSTARGQSQGWYPAQLPGCWCEWLASEHCTDLHHPPSPAAAELMGCDLLLYYVRNLLLLAHFLVAEMAQVGFFSIFLFML